MVGIVDEAGTSIEGDVGRFECRFDERGVVAPLIEDDCDVVSVLCSESVNNRVNDGRR